MFAELKSIARAALPQSLLRRRYAQRFLHERGWKNLHYGVFSSFESAKEFFLNRELTAKFDMDHLTWFDRREGNLHTHDYPVMFWASRFIGPTAHVFDLGGSLGVTYYLWRRHLTFPDDLKWEVCELPEVADRGRLFAVKRQTHQLRFTTDWQAMEGVDILHTAGTLQYIEKPLAEMLQAITQRPQHILINRMAVKEGATDIFLHNSRFR